MALLARGLSAKKYRIHLGLVTQAEAPPEYATPEFATSGFVVHTLGAQRVRGAAFALVSLVRQLRPDVLLSGMAHLNSLVLLLRPLFPARPWVLVRQNGTASAALAFGGLPWHTGLLYRTLYPRADCVICQSKSMAADMARGFSIPPDRIAVLHNPVPVEEIRQAVRVRSEAWPGAGPHLLAVGRLVREKGFDLLLEALVKVREKYAQTDLLLLGTGAEEEALKAQCRQLKLENFVRFGGHVDPPYGHFANASVFVLSSRHEGMPNALLEAAAAGLPIVSTAACGGVEELLRSQPGTWLTREISAQALTAALLDALERLRPGQRFEHAFLAPFRMDRAIAAYEELIDAYLEEKRR